MRFLLLLPILAISVGLVWFLFASTFSPFLKNKIISPQPPQQDFGLKISEPEDGRVVAISNLKVSGEGKPATFLAVFSENDSQVLKISESAEFSATLNLLEGYNQIKLVNFEFYGNSSEKTLEVFNLTEKFEKAIKFEGLSVDEATKGGKNQKLIERLSQLREKQKLTVVGGIIKGILGKNLALETKSSSKTVIVDKNTQIGNFPDFSQKIDFSQIQVQDFVVVIGSFSQQGILTAKILLVNPDKPPILTKTARFGIKTKTERDSLELTNPLDGKKEVISTENTDVFSEQSQKIKMEDIEIGNKLVVIGKISKDKLKAEKILVIASNFLSELEKFVPSLTATLSATQSAR